MITEKLDKHVVHEAQKLIHEASSIAIIPHVSPDGDAMGSALAFYHYLKTIGKDLVVVIVPNKFPDFLAWLPDADQILRYDERPEECAMVLKEADLLLCLDFNEPKRVGAMAEQLVASNAKKVLIDHHLNPDNFTSVTLSYPESPSTCELVFRYICQVGDFPLLNTTIATCIYTGMMTDTGNFSFNSNQVETYAIVSELVRLGVDKDAIYNKVFNSYTADRMRLMGYCLYNKMQLFKENHVALIAISATELMRFNFQSGDAEGLVNLPLQIADVYYSVFMREDTDKIKISFRSQGARPVNEFAHTYFGGGGHMNAAGGEWYGTLEEAVAQFTNHYKEFLNK